MVYTYSYPRPAVTVDAVILRKNVAQTELLLIRRKNPPFEGQWAFPGGFVEMDEDLDEAVAREIFEETGLKDLQFSQFRAYGNPKRDPRHRTITIVFTAWLDEEQQAVAADDAAEVDWFSLNHFTKLAFDHREILDEVIQHYNLA